MEETSENPIDIILGRRQTDGKRMARLSSRVMSQHESCGSCMRWDASQRVECACELSVHAHVASPILDGSNEFFIKWKGVSYHHCTWIPASHLIGYASGKQRLTGWNKREAKLPCNLQNGRPVWGADDMGNLFNPDYLEVDRIIDCKIDYSDAYELDEECLEVVRAGAGGIMCCAHVLMDVLGVRMC